jgi:acyl-CoA thioester hydrolase
MSAGRPETLSRSLAEPIDVSAGRIAMRVVYSDTDAMGVIYHARYLDLAERSRTSLMLAAGLDLAEIERDFGLLLMVNRLSADYRMAARLHDMAEIHTAILRRTAAQITWRSAITTQAGLCATVDVSTVCYSREQTNPVPIPPALVDACTRLPHIAEGMGRLDFVIAGSTHPTSPSGA